MTASEYAENRMQQIRIGGSRCPAEDRAELEQLRADAERGLDAMTPEQRHEAGEAYFAAFWRQDDKKQSRRVG